MTVSTWAEGVTLWDDGAARAVIVVADEPLALLDAAGRPRLTQRDAAVRLADLLQRAGGSGFEVVSLSDAPTEPPRIFVGDGPHVAQLGVEPLIEPEGVRIVVRDGDLYLLGEVVPAGTNNWAASVDRGTMHAVEIFLERVVGYRFYFSSVRDQAMFELGTVVPELDALTLPDDLDISDAPAFRYRVAHGTPGGSVIGYRAGQSEAFLANHTHHGWDRLYGGTHPEYFLLKADGTRDFRFLDYAEPGVLERELEHLATYFETGKPIGMLRPPTARYIAVEPDDNYPDSHSAAAQAVLDYDRHRWGRQSDLWFDYVRRLAAEVDQRWPHMRVSTLAYQWHTLPPTFDLPPNVDVMLCMMLSTTMIKEPEAFAHNLDLVEQWSAKLGDDPSRLYLWDYWCWPGFWTSAPTLSPRTQQRWLQQMRGRVGGVFINGGGHPDPYQHFMYAVWLRLLWDPDMNVEAFLADYCERFYGPAAEPMHAFYRLLIDRWEGVAWPQSISQSYASPLLIYGQTYPPAVIDELQDHINAARATLGMPLRWTTDVRGLAYWSVRNSTEAPKRFAFTATQHEGQALRPRLRWGGREVVYEGTLQQGDRLAVSVDGEATLERVALPAEELIPPARALSDDTPVRSNERYLVHRVRLDRPVQPGEKYLVRVRGMATDGGDSLIAFTESAQKQKVFMHGRFRGGDEMTTAEQVVTIPEGMTRLRWVDLFRGNKQGEVTYSQLSVTPYRPEVEPMSPINVTDRLRWSPIELGPGDAAVLAWDAQSPRAGSMTRVELFEADAVSAPTSLSIHHKRLAWMAKAFEVFHPTRSMYQTNNGFFVAARVAAPHVGAPPSLRVTSTEDAEAVPLVRGRIDARVPFENLGFPADVPTQLRFVRDGQRVMMHIDVENAPVPGETVTVLTRRAVGDKTEELVLPVGGDNPAAHWDAWSVTATGWRGTVILLTADDEQPLPKHLLVQVEHQRGDDRYVLSPRLDAPWGAFPPNRMTRLLLNDDARPRRTVPDDRSEPTDEDLPF